MSEAADPSASRVRPGDELRHRILVALADGEFHSGEALAGALGVSRAAVWKHLEALAEAGLGLDRQRGRGYRLTHPVELFDADAIRAAMGSPWNRQLQLHLPAAVASTNQFLADLPADARPQACLAEGQAAGRGRRGRQWLSAYGAGIPLSLAWHFHVLSAGVSALAPAIAVSLAGALEALGARGLRLKWPNDLLCEQGKLAGILIELRGAPEGPCDVIIGVGINWALPNEPVDQAAADLSAVMARPSRNHLAGMVLGRLCDDLGRYAEQGFAPFADAWAERDALAGRSVTLDLGTRQVAGCAQGLDEAAALCLREADGSLSRWQVGEVSLRPARSN
ncbi:biotin--[acetyl-CoA-carboxylase] ligase [Gammaproteobacteria bacterium AB-CW1]|uniref:Bifunctional ligase/repressor BirA n=1 Tax=Natronospira elongata TaxID=3110268 RepID=A0AAP6JHU6_9GAMM|nr:biotin--[acetyl-CoA-carboxylase] ligase [Gammaproteobacteria bacterium AB-CW1]